MRSRRDGFVRREREILAGRTEASKRDINTKNEFCKYLYVRIWKEEKEYEMQTRCVGS